MKALNRHTAQPRRYKRSLIAYRLLIFRFGRIGGSNARTLGSRLSSWPDKRPMLRCGSLGR
jgi:hypothetical protein